ncbi:MAG: hypothetical protein ACOY7T_12415 [Pseudomonadota bacterium]
MKFIKRFLGVKAGDVYPTMFEAGDECPPELLEAAKAEKVVAAKVAPRSDRDEQA